MIQPLSALRELPGQWGLGVPEKTGQHTEREKCGDTWQESLTQTLGQGSFPEGGDSERSPSWASELLRRRPGAHFVDDTTEVWEARQLSSGAAEVPGLRGRPQLRWHPNEHLSSPAQAQYRRGLELSKQAAQLGAAAGGAELPELVAFTSTQRAFQAKLTHFYMAAERQRTDLETLLRLYHFCKKVSLWPPAQTLPAPSSWEVRGEGAGSSPHTARGSLEDSFYCYLHFPEEKQGWRG